MLPVIMPRHISILPILSVNFIGTLGYSIVMPFLIFLVAKFGGNSVIFGILGATYSAFQLIGAPILGRYSDIYGRKPVLLISQIGTLLAWLIFLAALMMPVVSEPSKPKGLPLARTFWPTLRSSEEPNCKNGKSRTASI